MADVIAKCPKCESDDIREKNVAYAELPVTEWELNDSGELQPAGYDTDVDVEWEADDVDKQYVCGACKSEFNIANLEFTTESPFPEEPR